MTRDQIHALIDQMPETELHILARMLEGLNATRAVPATALVPPQAPSLAAAPQARSPIRPVGTPIRPRGNAPLANQFSDLIRQQESEHQSLLRKVMFTRVSDLVSWVNKG